MNIPQSQSAHVEGFANGNASNAAGHTPELNKNFILKHWFRPGHVGMLAAPPAHGKTSIIAALCARVALGHTFADLPVRRSGVYYLAPEDPVGVKDRAHPFLKDAPAATTPFYVIDRTPDFTNEAHVDGIIVDVLSLKARAKTESALVVVDTTNLSIGEADENSSSAMGGVIRNGHRIARETGSYVLFIHHTSHSDTSRARGSSAFGGNADDTFLLSRPSQKNGGNHVLLTPTKQKGEQLQPAIAFEIGAYKVGQDDDGDEVTVPMAVPLENPIKQPHNTNRPLKAKALGEARQDDMLRILTELHNDRPEVWQDFKLLQKLSGEPFSASRKNSDSLRVAVDRALKSLIAAGKVEAKDRCFRLKPDAT